jgi:serine/threonine-protein kinase
MSSMLGVLGDFQLEAELGRGGMGVVYRARQPSLDRVAAVKVIAPERAHDAVARERFVREACSLARVEHPNVVPIYQCGEASGELYLAMRLVDGPDLKALLATEGPLEPARAVRLVEQLAAALAAAHAQGLVHRDVKPRNVLVAAPGAREHAYLVDFGLARCMRRGGSLTTAGQCHGTLDYMAPEVLRGEVAGAAADIYSLGCLLYELLAGRVPFPADDEAAKIAAHLLRRPPELTGHGPAVSALGAVVRRALAKTPGDRYASVGELARAATLALAGRPTRAPQSVNRFSHPSGRDADNGSRRGTTGLKPGHHRPGRAAKRAGSRAGGGTRP